MGRQESLYKKAAGGDWTVPCWDYAGGHPDLECDKVSRNGHTRFIHVSCLVLLPHGRHKRESLGKTGLRCIQVLCSYFAASGSSMIIFKQVLKVTVRHPDASTRSCCLVAQSCLTLCNPMDCSPPGSSVHGMLQARMLAWAAISFSRGSSWPRDPTRASCTAGRLFTIWTTREAPKVTSKS